MEEDCRIKSARITQLEIQKGNMELGTWLDIDCKMHDKTATNNSKDEVYT